MLPSSLPKPTPFAFNQNSLICAYNSLIERSTPSPDLDALLNRQGVCLSLCWHFIYSYLFPLASWESSHPLHSLEDFIQDLRLLSSPRKMDQFLQNFLSLTQQYQTFHSLGLPRQKRLAQKQLALSLRVLSIIDNALYIYARSVEPQAARRENRYISFYGQECYSHSYQEFSLSQLPDLFDLRSPLCPFSSSDSVYFVTNKIHCRVAIVFQKTLYVFDPNVGLFPIHRRMDRHCQENPIAIELFLEYKECFQGVIPIVVQAIKNKGTSWPRETSITQHMHRVSQNWLHQARLSNKDFALARIHAAQYEIEPMLTLLKDLHAQARAFSRFFPSSSSHSLQRTLYLQKNTHQIGAQVLLEAYGTHIRQAIQGLSVTPLQELLPQLTNSTYLKLAFTTILTNETDRSIRHQLFLTAPRTKLILNLCFTLDLTPLTQDLLSHAFQSQWPSPCLQNLLPFARSQETIKAIFLSPYALSHLGFAHDLLSRLFTLCKTTKSHTFQACIRGAIDRSSSDLLSLFAPYAVNALDALPHEARYSHFPRLSSILPSVLQSVVPLRSLFKLFFLYLESQVRSFSPRSSSSKSLASQGKDRVGSPDCVASFGYAFSRSLTSSSESSFYTQPAQEKISSATVLVLSLGLSPHSSSLSPSTRSVMRVIEDCKPALDFLIPIVQPQASSKGHASRR